MNERKPLNKLQQAGGILVATVMFGVFFWLSFLLLNLLYQYTGEPPHGLTYVFSGILGLYLFAAAVKIIIDIHGKNHRNGWQQMLEETLEAMKRIAEGDFTVVMKVDSHDPLSTLAESVNKMARELGTMENLRQDFIANVSHEIQSPLTSISGFAALLRSETITSEDKKHYLDIIETESKRLSKLSDTLLKLSSLDAAVTPLSLSEFRLDKQIQNTVLTLEPHWSAKNIEISLDFIPVKLYGDENLLTQVWINLLQNAIKFTPDNGSIQISLSEDEHTINCSFMDSGIGLSEEDKLHIFERFYKVDKSRDRALGGNGLGLSLVKKIVELHQGSIHVDSIPGNGSTFKISFTK